MLTHLSFGIGAKELAILIPRKDMHAGHLRKHYLEPLERHGIDPETVIALSLEQNDAGKSPVSIIKPHLEQVKLIVDKFDIKTVLVCDSAYFKTLCGVRKTEPHYGYPKGTKWDGVTGFIASNYRSLFYNPNNAKKISFSLKALAAHMQNKPGMFDKKILLDCKYPTTTREIVKSLKKLHTFNKLTCDIETYSLKVDKAKLATISFAWDKHSGVAFHVGSNASVRRHLKKFFTKYKGTLIFHGASFDVKVLIWELFMSQPRDIKGMLNGLQVMFHKLEDTKTIAYLALNTTAGISLGLKDLAFEYTGNYALDDASDITKVSPGELLTYNMTDAVATWFVYNLYKPAVIATQATIYKDLFLPALKVITYMELVGMPINLGAVLNAETTMDDIARVHYKAIMSDPIIDVFNFELRALEVIKANARLKKLRKTTDDFLHIEFNPNSHTQLALLLHDHLELPVLNTTDGGKPATDSKTLNSLIQLLNKDSVRNADVIVLIEHVIELANVEKILNTFIPAFLNNSITKGGWEYLHGNFNLGGTKSGRLSSSKPNLTNIPSTGTKYAKVIKQCFQAPPYPYENTHGWLMVGADFFSLEDKVSALLTKDPNKLKIYTDGYDGHCLRAYKYFGDQMPDIIPDNVASINSIEVKYPELRQLSKSPTFLLTYMGTWHGLMKQFGFDEITAKTIENNYHDLYAVSDKWVLDKVREASVTGYLELAFGLRLRTPILPQIIFDSDSLPYQAQQEIRTAGNALGQSYGLLNTRAANEFMDRVWNSRYALKVLPISQIHDSQYYMIENTLSCLEWVNNNLIECMEWNKLAPIQHPTIKLGAALEVYYPDWSSPIKIPNHISIKEIKRLLNEDQRAKRMLTTTV